MHVPQNCDRSSAAAGVAFEGALTPWPYVVPGLVARLHSAEGREAEEIAEPRHPRPPA